MKYTNWISRIKIFGSGSDDMDRQLQYMLSSFFALCLYLLSSSCYAATLADITWPTTGTSYTAISSDGYFTRADTGWFEVYSGGPGGRNYLRINNPSSGAHWLIRTEDTLGDPDILVTRWWWRVGPNTDSSNRHDFLIDNVADNQSHPASGAWQMIKRSDVPSSGQGNVVALDFEGKSYCWGPFVGNQWTNMESMQWYLMEYRINKTNGTFEIRIDGVDVTNDFYRYDFGYQHISLADDNGSFTFTTHNYFKIDTYDKETQSAGDMIEDIAGVKITDGPNWIGGDDPLPPELSVHIMSPTSSGTYSTSEDSLNISGSASYDNSISTINWSNDRGGNGTANNDSGNFTEWSADEISLQEGSNIITVTVTDSAGPTSTDTINVEYSASGVMLAWSAFEQTGDSIPKNSSVTYCARLLVEGQSVAQSGNKIQLGLQGRTSGDYTISKVSIAERDITGSEGDVVDSTWTEVTFDGNIWNSSVTVPAGVEKLSDTISFEFQAEKDYYVTFKIDSPSIYLNPPSGYRELYFESADHTEDIDWSGNGHLITQDFHALSTVYVMPPQDSIDSPADFRLIQ